MRKKIFYKEELNLREDSENIDVYKHLLNGKYDGMYFREKYRKCVWVSTISAHEFKIPYWEYFSTEFCGAYESGSKSTCHK